MNPIEWIVSLLKKKPAPPSEPLQVTNLDPVTGLPADGSIDAPQPIEYNAPNVAPPPTSGFQAIFPPEIMGRVDKAQADYDRAQTALQTPPPKLSDVPHDPITDAVSGLAGAFARNPNVQSRISAVPGAERQKAFGELANTWSANQQANQDLLKTSGQLINTYLDAGSAAQRVQGILDKAQLDNNSKVYVQQLKTNQAFVGELAKLAGDGKLTPVGIQALLMGQGMESGLANSTAQKLYEDSLKDPSFAMQIAQQKNVIAQQKIEQENRTKTIQEADKVLLDPNATEFNRADALRRIRSVSDDPAIAQMTDAEIEKRAKVEGEKTLSVRAQTVFTTARTKYTTELTRLLPEKTAAQLAMWKAMITQGWDKIDVLRNRLDFDAANAEMKGLQAIGEQSLNGIRVQIATLDKEIESVRKNEDLGDDAVQAHLDNLLSQKKELISQAEAIRQQYAENGAELASNLPATANAPVERNQGPVRGQSGRIASMPRTAAPSTGDKELDSAMAAINAGADAAKVKARYEQRTGKKWPLK